MTRRIICVLLASMACVMASAGEQMDSLVSRVVSRAMTQFVDLDARLSPDTFPRTWQDGRALDSDMSWWCSGFFPGSCWYLYELTGDENIKAIAEKNTFKLEGICSANTDHDIGFQVNCSFGNAYRLTSDSDYLPVIRDAAEKLARRFSPVTGTIKSWDWAEDRWEHPVIIDNMMNLELLMNASILFGADSLADVACTHALTTMKNHFRADHSSYHLVDYSVEDGRVLKRQTFQGYADESRWSRGQAWALYGFTSMYSTTGDVRFLDMAENIADMVISLLPDDCIPYWDADAPSAEGKPVLRDVSAAAIMCSALLDLCRFADPADAALYREVAEKQLESMASDEYLAEPGTNGGFLLKHGVGNLPGGSEIDVPLSYADYYLMEALVRLGRLDKCLFADGPRFKLVAQRADAGDRTISLLEKEVMEEAGESVAAPEIERVFDSSNRRILQQSRRAMKEIASCAYAWHRTKDWSYLDRAVHDLETVCAFSDWNPSHFLDVAEMSMAVAIGYDWLRNDLSSGQKAMIRNTLLEKAIKPGLQPQSFYMNANNWNQVCIGGLVTAALAVMGPSDPWTVKLLNHALDYNKNCMDLLYYPDGIYTEGPVYWEYGTMYEVMMIDALQSFLGRDYGLYATEGFEKSAEFARFSVGASGRLFNYSDNVSSPKASVPLWYFASRTGDASLLKWDMSMLENGRLRNKEMERFMPVLLVMSADTDFGKGSEEQGHFFYGDGENPLFAVHTDWTFSESDKYLAAKGGGAGGPHSHMDAGSFVFDAYGFRWAADPDRDGYAKWENDLRARGGDLWDMAQESLRWTIPEYNNKMHNTLTINDMDHRVGESARILETYSEGPSYGGKLDISDVFGGAVRKAERTFFLDEDGNLVITDTVTACEDASADVRWTMFTPARVKVRRKGLELVQGDVVMRLVSSGAPVKYRKWGSSQKGYSVCGYETTVAAGETAVIRTVMERIK